MLMYCRVHSASCAPAACNLPSLATVVLEVFCLLKCFWTNNLHVLRIVARSIAQSRIRQEVPGKTEADRCREAQDACARQAAAAHTQGDGNRPCARLRAARQRRTQRARAGAARGRTHRAREEGA